MLRPRTVYLYAALLLLTLGAYLPVWNNGFIDWDDEGYITANPHVREGLTWSGFAWVWTSDAAVYWQPLSWLSLQVDAQLFSAPSKAGPPVPSAAASHGVSLFWHAASVLLLFGLWYRLTGARWRSFLVAALFAVHPLHVESVAWAAERKDVLSVFFGLVTLWAYVHYLDRPGWRRYSLVAVAYLLSLMSKPMLMTLPLVMLLLDYWPLQRMDGGRWTVDGGEPASSPSTVHRPPSTEDEPPLTWKSVSLAWAPYALMSVLLLLTGLVRQAEGRGPVMLGPIRTNYMVPVPGLHNEVMRAPELHDKDKGEQQPE